MYKAYSSSILLKQPKPKLTLYGEFLTSPSALVKTFTHSFTFFCNFGKIKTENETTHGKPSTPRNGLYSSGQYPHFCGAVHAQARFSRLLWDAPSRL